MCPHALLLDCTALEDVAAVAASAHALGQMPPDVIRGRVGMPVDRVQDFTFVQTVFEICITAPSSSLDRFISPIMRASLCSWRRRCTGRDARHVNAAHDVRDPDDIRGERGRWVGAVAPACYPARSRASRRNT